MHRRISLAGYLSMMAPIPQAGERRFWNSKLAIRYTTQGDLFSKSIRQGAELPVPLEGSIRNMAVIEAIFRSGKSRKWEEPLV